MLETVAIILVMLWLLEPVEISVNEKHTVNIPIWARVTAIALGAGLLVAF